MPESQPITRKDLKKLATRKEFDHLAQMTQREFTAVREEMKEGFAQVRREMATKADLRESEEHLLDAIRGIQNPSQKYASSRVARDFLRPARREEEAIAVATATTINAARRENTRNPEGYGQFRLSTASLLLGVSAYTFVVAPCASQN